MNDESNCQIDIIKIEEDLSATPQDLKIEEAKNIPPQRELVSIKKWSENKQRFYYQPKDPDYAKKHYWKTKHDMVCAVCGRTITTAMFRHVKSLRCLMVRDAVRKALDKNQIEADEAIHQGET
jgi:hypothetical protein